MKLYALKTETLKRLCQQTKTKCFPLVAEWGAWDLGFRTRNRLEYFGKLLHTCINICWVWQRLKSLRSPVQVQSHAQACFAHTPDPHNLKPQILVCRYKA